MEESLKNKAVNGVSWSMTKSVVTYAVHFIVGIILARLLSPDDYGLIGLIMIFTAIADCITISGFFSSLIQKKNANEDDYNTMFVSNMVSSTFMYLLLFFGAPFIAKFFNRIELINLVRVQSLSLVISAFSLVQRARLNKQLDFKTPTKVAIITSLFSGVFGITMAFCGCGVWSLVIPNVASSILSAIMYCCYNKWIPQFRFSIVSFKALFGYGWKILIAELFDCIFMQTYQFVVGKFYSPATLGQYTRGKGFSDLISTNIYNMTRDVTFPVLSQLQTDKERSKDAFRKMVRMLMFITVIPLFGMAAVAKPMILVLIGEKWLPSVFFLQILCFGSLLYPINATNMNLLKSQGRSDFYLVLSLIRKFLEIGPICLGVFVDIKWMVLGMVINNWIGFFIYSHYAGKTIGYSSMRQFIDLLPSIGIAAAMAVPVWLLSFLPINSSILILVMQLTAGCILTIMLCKTTGIQEYKEAKEIAVGYIKRFFRR